MTQVHDYLIKLGLTSSQSKALEVLFEGESYTAKEISQESGVPYTKIYKSMDELVNRGLVEYTLDNPRVYKSLKPQRVFDTLLEQAQHGVDTLKEDKENFLKDLSSTFEKSKEYPFESSIWVIQGEKAVWDGFTEDLIATKKYFCGAAGREVMKTMWMTPGTIEAFYGAHVKRGVKAEGIYSADFDFQDFKDVAKHIGFTRASQRFYKLLKVLSHEKHHTRQLPEGDIFTDFTITDRKLLHLGLRNEHGVMETSWKITNKQMVKSFQDYFNMLLEKSTPMGSLWFEKLKGMKKK